MFTRFVLALTASLAFFAIAHAADLPAGTWAANIDGTKGDFVVKEIKDGKFTGVLLGTDVSGTWDGKALTFQTGGETYEAHLVGEPGEKGQTKYTLTGTKSKTVRDFTNRAGTIHVVKTGWYAQLAAATPVATGEIKAEVRGVLVVGNRNAYVSVKREVGGGVEETQVGLSAGGWKEVPAILTELNGKEVIVTGSLAQKVTNLREEGMRTTLHFRGKFDIKAATPPK